MLASPGGRPAAMVRAVNSEQSQPAAGFPHKIALLCDLRDADGNVLLIHRHKEPNKNLYSPIGGKLELALGESPLMGARREIHEEAGIEIEASRLRLVGIISERGFEGQTNWLMFWYRVLGPVEVEERTFEEGRLEWRPVSDLPRKLGATDSVLPMPQSDIQIIWPLVLAHEEGFFSVYIDCTGDEPVWTVEESRPGC